MYVHGGNHACLLDLQALLPDLQYWGDWAILHILTIESNGLIDALKTKPCP